MRQVPKPTSPQSLAVQEAREDGSRARDLGLTINTNPHKLPALWRAFRDGWLVSNQQHKTPDDAD